MKRKIKWPDGRTFAFTIVDDTDGATLENIKPVYDYLAQKGLLTTKTCWAFPPKDKIYKGSSLEDREYTEYLKELSEKGFEMAFHNAGSGGHNREETLKGFESFRKTFGDYPKMHINHSNCIENIYWGAKRFHFPINVIYRLIASKVKSYGHMEKSEYFWGDICKKHIKYVRNRTFNGLNTLKEDNRLVYPECGKEEYANYWFSSSNGMNIEDFSKIMTKENIDRLAEEEGCSILYTHLAYGFVDEKGELDKRFKDAIDYISGLNGWFVTASEMLDYILKQNEYKKSYIYELKMDIKWLFERVMGN